MVLADTSPLSASRTPHALAPAVLITAALSVAMAQTIVVAALPRFGAQLGVDASSATWLLTAFMLASAVATPIAGRLGDLYGHRGVLGVGLVLLAIGSVVAGVADVAGSFPSLVVGRVLQGSAGGVFPVAFGMVRHSATPPRRHGLIAALSATFGVGGALGMVIAGPLVDIAGTASLFWTTGALAVIALAGLPFLAADRPDHGAEPARLDLAGAGLLAASLVLLLLGISQGRAWGWVSPVTLACFLSATVAGTAFVLVERRTPHPLVDMRLLRHRTLAGTNAATIIISIGMFAAVTLIPQLVQTPPTEGFGFGYSASQTGVLLIPTAALMVVAAPIAARLSARTSSRLTFQTGAVLACLSLVLTGLFHQYPWELYLSGAILGLAYGLAFASLGGLVMNSVGHHEAGAATGLNTILRTVGGALGAQLAAVALATSAPSASGPTDTGYMSAFLIAAGVALAALLAAMAARHPHVQGAPIANSEGEPA